MIQQKGGLSFWYFKAMIVNKRASRKPTKTWGSFPQPQQSSSITVALPATVAPTHLPTHISWRRSNGTYIHPWIPPPSCNWPWWGGMAGTWHIYEIRIHKYTQCTYIHAHISSSRGIFINKKVPINPPQQASLPLPLTLLYLFSLSLLLAHTHSFHVPAYVDCIYIHD